MKLKLDDAGHAVLKDGHPIYVHDDGKEIPFDAAGTVATISRLNGEAKTNRERAEGAEAKLKTFDPITDVSAALKALETVGKLSDKKLIEAGEVDKVRGEAIKAVEDKYAPVVAERDSLKSALVNEKVGGSFARSKLIPEKLVIPADLVQARFGDAFKLEGDSVVAYDKGGNKIFSRAKPGEVASFDEALEILIDSYPYKDSILKGTGASGGGASGGGGANGSKRIVRRAEFEKFDPATQAATAKAASAGTVSIVD
jgi:hypothetical protein